MPNNVIKVEQFALEKKCNDIIQEIFEVLKKEGISHDKTNLETGVACSKKKQERPQTALILHSD